jgi:hypothetical protein
VCSGYWLEVSVPSLGFRGIEIGDALMCGT